MKCAELAEHVGRELGVSDWLCIDQSMIDRFADVTRDRQWIHVDVERATREMGTTIAHGFLVLSLLSTLSAGLLAIEDVRSALNYGFNRIRLTAPVPCGTRVRLRQTLSGVQQKSTGLLLTSQCEVEIEGHARPALVAEWLTLVTP